MKKFLLILSCCVFFADMCYAQLNGNGYYRIKSEKSDKYLSLVDDDINFQTIVGSASSLNSDEGIAAAMTRAGVFIGKDIKLVEEKEYDPANILYIKSSNGYYDIQAQGLSLISLTTGKFVGNLAGEIPITGKGVTFTSKFTSNGSFYTIKLTLTGKYRIFTKTLSAFLYDSEGTLGVHTTTNTNFAVEPVSSFKIKPVNENVKDSEGNYWTTLITAFPYVIPSGGSVLGAYTVTATTDEDGKTFAVPTLLSSPGETVSAGTPVLLKLSGDADTWSLNLKDTHVIGTPDQKISDNLLSGVYFGNKVANDKDNYRVLGVNKSGTIGFYKYSGDTMNANKVWLDLSSVAGAKGSVFLDLDGEATGIDEIEEEPIVCEGVYDIQGRRVAETLESVSLPKGLYIVNGKKVFIK